MNGFFGAESSYRTKKDILISAICFIQSFLNFLNFEKSSKKLKKSRSYKASRKFPLKALKIS